MAPALGYESVADFGPNLWSKGLTSPPKSILYIDAYDSFSYNVVAMLEEVLGVKVTVMMIDSKWPDNNMAQCLERFDAVVLGPGPGNPSIPRDVGIMQDIWRLSDDHLVPVLGICLGFQSLCLYHGIPIERLPAPLHGQIHQISTAQTDIFEGLQGAGVTLYHSLYAQADPRRDLSSNGQSGSARVNPPAAEDLEFVAWSSIEQGSSSDTVHIPMAVRHRRKPFWGVQFHPESCKSDRKACTEMLRRWWQTSLTYNKKFRRAVTESPSAELSSQINAVTPLPDIVLTMLEWSASTSHRSHFRSFTSHNFDAETLLEYFNTPGSPAVLFQSNGKHSVISVPSPTSWRLEYYTQSEELVLETLPDPWTSCKATDSRRDVSACSLLVAQFWDVLRHVMHAKKVDTGDQTVPFWGGFLGYFSYEMGLACLARPKHHDDISHHGFPSTSEEAFSEDPPDVSLIWTERSIVIDNETGRITIQSTLDSDESPDGWLSKTLQSLVALSTEPIDAGNNAGDADFLDSILRRGTVRFPDEESYQNQVEACKDELEAGESYELCLTCETSITLPSPDTDSGRRNFPWKLYRRLRKYNPAAFSAYARLGDVKIVSSSPECFLNWDRTSTLEMKPMKGTVRKSSDMTLEKAKEILGSRKEMAENLMIADLIRHDLYGICGSGGVSVEKLLEVEDHGRVYQMITHVKGQVDPKRPSLAVRDMPQLQSSNMSGYGLVALQRCLPPGSMTGAPKERSCMHLSAIEGRNRGIYSGVMGFLDLGGGGSFSVLIRTAFTCSADSRAEQRWRIGAGGAVTTLSTAQGEWDEMLTKLKTVCGIFTPHH